MLDPAQPPAIDSTPGGVTIPSPAPVGTKVVPTEPTQMTPPRQRSANRSAAVAHQELAHAQYEARCFNDPLSPSPAKGATFGTASGHDTHIAQHSPEHTNSPGPGAYLGERSGNHRGGSISQDVRFKAAAVTPGPGEYKYAKQSPRSPMKGAVFGSQAQRAKVVAVQPGPGSYAVQGGCGVAAQGGSFTTSRKVVSQKLANPTSLTASVQALPSTRAAKGCSFGKSRRFEGPDSYTERASVPGPGEYNVTVRRLQHLGHNVGRSRTPPSFRPLGLAKGASSVGAKGRRQSASFQRSTSLSTPSKRGTPQGRRAARPSEREMPPPLGTDAYDAEVRRAAIAAAVAATPVLVPPQPIPLPLPVAVPSAQELHAAHAAAAAAAAHANSVAAASSVWPATPVPVAAPLIHTPLSPTPGECAWADFCQRCRSEGLEEDELTMLSLATLKTLMKQVGLFDVVDAARVEVQWKQLRLAKNLR